VNEMLVIARAAMSEGYGKCMTAKLPTGETASAVLVLYDRKTCYYLFAGNHPDFRKSGASSYLILKAIEKFKEEGKVYFDFIGINSPSRGDFKISFNANPTPYYITNWRRP
jgi:lipid II:glycine glycyltransferase (peptidoglycan interpeptide bridge formation enzyme)